MFDIKTIASMKGIALDAINKAGQGHIGMAIGAANITYTLVGHNLKITSAAPKWIDRDRFVMSAGHGSMALYSIMHFMGRLTVEDIKAHKQLNSKTPSHPEIDQTDFVDATTGPLGQGVAMGVGMAISQLYLAKKYNRPNFPIFDHNVFVLHGDGCLQEGVCSEALQLAGTLNLNKLILIHDFNNIQIDSKSTAVNATSLVEWFKAMHFDTIVVAENTPKAIDAAIKKARKAAKPTYIQVATVIAEGTPVANTPSGHNGVLNDTETNKFKKDLGLPVAAPFVYDASVYSHGKELAEKKEPAYANWIHLKKEYANKFPKEAKELEELLTRKYNIKLDDIRFKEKNVATRNYVGEIIKALESSTFIVGGSADLASATKVAFAKPIEEGGKNIRYGIREFAMTAINNGIYLDSGLRTVDATFLVFADYAKAAYRLGAIMEIPSIHVLTHDSYQVGGDGPTHQAVEQLAMLRSMPGAVVIRPCDEKEMLEAFNFALARKDGPTFIVACRQPIPSYDAESNSKRFEARKIHGDKSFSVSLLASGSEVSLAVKVSETLAKKGILSQVISVPVLQVLIQDTKLAQGLGLDRAPMFAIEASSDLSWYALCQYGKIGAFLAKGYGYSAPGDVVYAEKGFTAQNIAGKVENFLKSKSN